MAPRVEYFLQCTHCGVLLPITGTGSKTVIRHQRIVQSKHVKADEEKVDLKAILGEHYDAFFAVRKIFGGPKDLKDPKPSISAAMYMNLLATGKTDEAILAAAKALFRSRGEVQFMPKFVRFLESHSEIEGPTNGSTSRFTARVRAK